MATQPMKYDVPHKGLSFCEWYADHNVYHPGQDYNFGANGNSDMGADVVSFSNADVEYMSAPPSKLNGQNGGLGNFVVLYHPAYGVWSRSCHLKTINTIKGERIKEGEKIGTCGNTGTTWAHLHFEIFDKTVYDIIKKHWRPFAWYPSGKPKNWITQHYFDPIIFIEDINKEKDKISQVDTLFKEAHDWVMENKISNGERPKDPITRQEAWQMLLNYNKQL